MNIKGMFYTNVSDYETKEDMMNDFIALRMYDMAKDKEIERLHSVIKEVREYIKDNTVFIDWFLGGNRKVPKIELTEQGYMKLLEILEKENK